jgi:glutamine amidotransferase
MISIIDYGMGNLHSVQKALELVGAETQIVTEPAGIEAARKVILPGVGAFADAIDTLRQKGLVDPIKQAIHSGKPFLGICLGLQLLFDVSYEDGEHEGLGVVPGKVVRFDFSQRDDARELKIPHMGWNALRFTRDFPLYRGVEPGAYVYFVHSYYVEPDDKSVIATTTDHGGEFVSSIARDNLFATQFHPEKSQRVGLAMLKNFAAL